MDITIKVTDDNIVVINSRLGINDGRQLGRFKVTKNIGIDVPPIVVDNTVYIYAKDGTLAALRTRSH